MLAAPLVKVQRIPRVSSSSSSSSLPPPSLSSSSPPPLPPCCTGESPVQAGRAIFSPYYTGGVCVTRTAIVVVVVVAVAARYASIRTSVARMKRGFRARGKRESFRRARSRLLDHLSRPSPPLPLAPRPSPLAPPVSPPISLSVSRAHRAVLVRSRSLSVWPTVRAAATAWGRWWWLVRAMRGSGGVGG